ncbi:MAG: sigma-70 family RNA polymerase sigma factor [Acidobacteriota bacterium]
MDHESAPDQSFEERRLLRDLDRGEAAAFDRFVATYSPVLWRYAQAHLGADAAPDIVQSTLLVAVERLDSFRHEGPLGAWLVSICRHQVLDYRRRHSVRARHAAPDDLDLDRFEGGGPSASESLERLEERASVHSTLELLPPPYGEVLEWKYLEEISVKEIAVRLAVSPKAAESTLTRARSAFRRFFKPAPLSWSNP